MATAEVWETGWCDGWRPDPTLLVSEWADANRVLPAKAAAEPGRWRTSRTPYLREPMDCLSAYSPVQRVVIMAGAQIGKTEAGLNWFGYIVDHAPGPMLMVQPTVETAKRVSKQRLAPMIDETPSVRAKIADPRARDSGNTQLLKEFPGGLVILTGANSAVGLRSMPVRYLFGDEVDAYPLDADGEGDPVSLAEKRTTTFSRRKILLTSTPTTKGSSRIEKEFLASDQRRYFVPCPHCQNMDWIRWSNIKWDKDDHGKHHPETVALLCEACGVLIEERHKTWMLERGEWRATAEGDGLTAGFHISSLYSPLGWKSWRQIIEEFLKAKGDRSFMRTWVNTVLGETFEEEGDAVAPALLKKRQEAYGAEVPDGAACLVMTCDTQDNRVETQVVAFGPGDESWLIDYQVIWGNPTTDPEVWTTLEAQRLREFTRADGVKMVPSICLIDSGGHHADAVYDFVIPRQNAKHRTFAIRGVDFHSRPILVQDGSAKNKQVRLFTVATHVAKEVFYSRLRINKPGPGYVHLPGHEDVFPGRGGTTDEYLDQVTSERKVRYEDPKTHVIKVEWVKQHARNEALDMWVYALGGLFVLQTYLAPAIYGDLAKLLEHSRGKAKLEARKPGVVFKGLS